MQSKVKSKTATKEELANYLLTNLTVMELAGELAEYILKSKETVPPINVTQEELDRITSLFKVKGIRMVEGEVIRETRGRRPKNQPIIEPGQ